MQSEEFLRKIGQIARNRQQDSQHDDLEQWDLEDVAAIISDFFSPTGLLARHSPAFEYRSGQQQMALALWRALSNGQTLMVEAGTGVGKSLAYLVPAIIWSLLSGQRIGISTETKALQEQLLQKEIPFLSKIGFEFEAKQAYGNANYLCRRKLVGILEKGDFLPDEAELLQQISNWVRTTQSGLRHKMPFSVPVNLWARLHREGDNSLNRHCPYYQNCFYQQAKKSWQKSSLLLLNHALYFANRASANKILPEFEVCIFDEAHALEKIITDQFSFQLTQRNLDTLLLYLSQGKPLSLIAKFFPQQQNQTINSLLVTIKKMAAELFQMLPKPEKGRYINITTPQTQANNLISQLSSLIDTLRKKNDELKDKGNTEEESLALETSCGRLEQWLAGLEELAKLDKNDMVYWIESEAGDQDILSSNASLNGAPISVKTIIRQGILEKHDSAFFVSATLTVGNKFSYFQQRLGLPIDIVGMVFDSPFDYQQQVLLYSSAHIADPKDSNDDYIAHLIYIIKRLIAICGGHAFILFTSYRTMQSVLDGLPELQESDYSIVVQDGRPANVVLREYLESPKPLLFGTSSFWQGIDVAGDSLRMVVITRIPFTVPDDPVNKARVEQLEKNGVNAFVNYSVPMAAIRLKQGFGRLIRRKQDLGIVAILDPRLHTKNYGKTLLQTLPQSQHIQKLDLLEKAYAKLINNN